MAAAISLKEVAIGVGFQFKTLSVELLSSVAFFPMKGIIPRASRSTRACLFIAQWRDLGDGAVMKLHPDYESVVPMLARFVKATDT
jgi:hypothetical protein